MLNSNPARPAWCIIEVPRGQPYVRSAARYSRHHGVHNYSRRTRNDQQPVRNTDSKVFEAESSIVQGVLQYGIIKSTPAKRSTTSPGTVQPGPQSIFSSETTRRDTSSTRQASAEASISMWKGSLWKGSKIFLENTPTGSLVVLIRRDGVGVMLLISNINDERKCAAVSNVAGLVTAI